MLVVEALRRKQWDGFKIGVEARSNKQYIQLLEGVVNAYRVSTLGTKLLFSTAPDAVYNAIPRAFPEVYDDK